MKNKNPSNISVAWLSAVAGSALILSALGIDAYREMERRHKTAATEPADKCVRDAGDRIMAKFGNAVLAAESKDWENARFDCFNDYGYPNETEADPAPDRNAKTIYRIVSPDQP